MVKFAIFSAKIEGDATLQPMKKSPFGKGGFIPGCVQMVVFVAAGFSLRRPGETPVPPRKVGRKIFDWSQLETSAKLTDSKSKPFRKGHSTLCPSQERP
ncbi:MAG TPA: hypothetical protein VGA79_02960 [Desulfobaccales bacterium]